MENNNSKKHLSPLSAFALALGCIVGWGSFVMPGTTFLPEAGPAGTAIALAIACVIMLVFATCFHHMMNRIPENGGAFTYATAAFGRGRGFLCGWFLILAYLAPIALNATAMSLVARTFMGNLLEFGFSYNIAGYDTYFGEILVMFAVLALVAYVAYRWRGVMAKVQVLFVACLVVGVGIIFVACVLSPDAVAVGAQPAFSEQTSPVAGVLIVLSVSPWLYIGFDALSQSTGEFSFSPRKSGLIMGLAIVVGTLIYIGLTCVGASVVPEGYANWLQYVLRSNSLFGLEAMPVSNATYHVLGDAGVIVLDLAMLGALLSGIVGFFLAAVRLLQTMAQAKVLPEWFAVTDMRYGTPRNAIAFLFLIAFMASLFGRTILNWVMDMASAGVVLCFLYTSLAVATYARRESRRGLMAVGIVGVVFSVAFLVLLFVPLPMLSSSMGLESIVFLIAWAALGANYYTPTAAIMAPEES